MSGVRMWVWIKRQDGWDADAGKPPKGWMYYWDGRFFEPADDCLAHRFDDDDNWYGKWYEWIISRILVALWAAAGWQQTPLPREH